MTIADERKSARSVEGDRPGNFSRARARAVAITALERYALVLLGICLVILFASLEGSREAFVSTANIRTLLGNQSVVALIAIASIIPLVAVPGSPLRSFWGSLPLCF